ncbi:MAG: hypothetical protein LPH21_15790 [Shewanella sp.]|nr:hypothetical protein [Shewanella sp.]
MEQHDENKAVQQVDREHPVFTRLAVTFVSDAVKFDSPGSPEADIEKVLAHYREAGGGAAMKDGEVCTLLRQQLACIKPMDIANTPLHWLSYGHFCKVMDSAVDMHGVCLGSIGRTIHELLTHAKWINVGLTNAPTSKAPFHVFYALMNAVDSTIRTASQPLTDYSKYWGYIKFLSEVSRGTYVDPVDVIFAMDGNWCEVTKTIYMCASSLSTKQHLVRFRSDMSEYDYRMVISTDK